MSGPRAPLTLWPGRVPADVAKARVEDSRSGSGVTLRDKKSREVIGFGIPMAETAHGRTVRVHEALHGTYDSLKLPPGDWHEGITQIIEDIRVQLRFPDEPAVIRDALATTIRERRNVERWAASEEGQAALAHGVPWQVVAALARASATLEMAENVGYYGPDGGRFLGPRARRELLGAPSSLHKIINEVVRHVKSADPQSYTPNKASQTRNLKRACTLLQTLLAPEAEPEREQGEQGEVGAEGEGGSASGDPGVGTGEEAGEAPKSGDPTPVGKDANTKGKRKDPTKTLEEILAQCHMKIEELTPRCMPTRRMRSPSWKPGSTGPRMRMTLASRALAGQNAYGFFRRRKASHNRIGTVLIDASGSMGVTHEKMQDLLEFAPGAVIAIYSGYGAGSGVLAIWSRGGKHYNGVDGLPIFHGNAIDLPAIVWLLKQEGPRVMVTDRGFCGGPEGADMMAHTILGRAELRKQVTVIESLSEARERFEKAERTGGEI